MTWNTILSCAKCGAIYNVEVWNLGHKESDQINCECCGEEIRSWKNEAHSYSISSIKREGSLKLLHKDWEQYVGKRLRFSKGDQSIEGKVLGLDTSFRAVTNATTETLDNSWLIETEDGHYSIFPEDDWQVCIIIE